MSENPSNSTQKRRNVLKKLGAGAALPIASLGDTGNDTVRLPELRNQDGVVSWTEVPKVWNTHRKRVERVAEKFKSSYGNRSGVVEVGITAAPERFGGKPGFEVEVGVDPERLQTEIPDQIDNISVRTTEKTEPPVELCKNDSYSGLPGGVLVVNGNLDGSGTTGWQAEYNGKTVMLTAQHVVPDKDTVYGDKNSLNEVQEIGTVVGRNYGPDVAAIETNRDVKAEIPTPNGTFPVGGWVTKSGISERVSDPFDGYQKMGNTTGQTFGGLGKYQIDDSYSSSTRSFGGEGVRGDASAADGDSGGPAYSVHNGEAFVTHLVTSGDPKAGRASSNSNCDNIDPYKKSIGAAAYHLNSIGYQAVGSSRQ